MNTLNNQKILRLALLVGMAATLWVVGTGVVVAAGVAGSGFSSDAERIVFGTLTALAGAAMTAGLLLSPRAPRIGLTVLVAGVVGISILWYWAAFITIPAGIALLGIAHFRGRRLRQLSTSVVE